MKPTIRQIAAGLALAELSPEELAKDIGVVPTQLGKIMSNEVAPSPELLDRIKIALEARQVEFGPRFSVALKDEYFRRLIGDEVFLQLLDEVLRTMMGRSDEVLFFMLEPSMWIKEELDAELRLWDAGIKCRYLCPDDNTMFNAPKEAYRMVPRLYKASQMQIIYSDYVAIISEEYEAEGIAILNSASAADMERGKFNFIWDRSPPPA